MDAVRFGRALGFGARQAVKTVTSAVSAATAENPSAKEIATGANTGAAAARPIERSVADSTKTASQTTASKAAHRAAQTVVQARGASKRLRRGGRSFGGTAWKTFTRLGGVLWLEVSGVFFGLFALFALVAVLHLHGEWRPSAAGRWQLAVALAMLAFFGYFCVSNFLRARRRERRR